MKVDYKVFRPSVFTNEEWIDIYIDDVWLGSARTKEQADESVENFKKKAKK